LRLPERNQVGVAGEGLGVYPEPADVFVAMFRCHGADGILLFFEPVERLALLTFDWC
jgi:hypothetical protein